jgi:transposase
MKKVVLVGIDVGSRELVVATPSAEWVVDNTAQGHRRMIRKLTKGGRTARVVVESTGIYHLDLALALHESKGTEVMVANPRAVRDFGRARFQRSKTDKTDAAVLLAFAERMPFQPWCPPPPEIWELRALSRRISALTQTVARERNRLHATRHEAVREDIEILIQELERHVETLSRQALEIVHRHEELNRRFKHLISVKGIGPTSALRLLAELCVLPDDMTPRQWVAHAGLDPRQHQSGTSIHKPARISKVGNAHVRAALYMPALVAIRHEPQVAAYYAALIARGKKPLQAIVAVMRKLLHAIHGMLAHDQDFDGEKFYALRA